METETLRPEVKVKTLVDNLPTIAGATNTVLIFLKEVIHEESGTVRVSEFDHIRLNPHGGFTPDHLYRLLRGQQVPFSQSLGVAIASDIDAKLARDNLLREPLFVTVHVKFIKKRRLILPPPPPPPVLPAPSRGASREVLQRLAKEQRVEPMDLGEESESDNQCSICFEDWYKCYKKNIIEMPQCLHMFHQQCLFEWLRRQNSCPLCRSVPYE
ncbi:hypothetical protein EUTSA_v10028290mg [Eutrema salsugineum]|uniref:RING-type E3 ubiquitin transferase n=1 Tax=Eutrema salsugineum TaxID=72664 RepID=V4LTZ5_EUTSA|nr:uncharacterized protein LOC18022421 [Eutrema salsugineum]ESQ47299.1 hypothetical protein EUTSA_v10028290mg [Eutrema salsugineum]